MTWRKIDSVPRDGTPVLVWLKEPSLGSHVHSARFSVSGKPNIIGHHFDFDVGEAIYWMPQPDPPDGKDHV